MFRSNRDWGPIPLISLGTEFHIFAPLNMKLFFMLFVRGCGKTSVVSFSWRQ